MWDGKLTLDVGYWWKIVFRSHCRFALHGLRRVLFAHFLRIFCIDHYGFWQVSNLAWPATQVAAARTLHVSCSKRAAELSSILEERIMGSAPKVCVPVPFIDIAHSMNDINNPFSFRPTSKKLDVSWALVMVSLVCMVWRTFRLMRWWSSHLALR